MAFTHQDPGADQINASREGSRGRGSKSSARSFISELEPERSSRSRSSTCSPRGPRQPARQGPHAVHDPRPGLTVDHDRFEAERSHAASRRAVARNKASEPRSGPGRLSLIMSSSTGQVAGESRRDRVLRLGDRAACEWVLDGGSRASRV